MPTVKMSLQTVFTHMKKSNGHKGIDIEDFSMTVDFPEKEGKEKIKKQKVNLSVWDFAGQGLKFPLFFSQ